MSPTTRSAPDSAVQSSQSFVYRVFSRHRIWTSWPFRRTLLNNLRPQYLPTILLTSSVEKAFHWLPNGTPPHVPYQGSQEAALPELVQRLQWLWIFHVIAWNLQSVYSHQLLGSKPSRFNGPRRLSLCSVVGRGGSWCSKMTMHFNANRSSSVMNFVFFTFSQTLHTLDC